MRHCSLGRRRNEATIYIGDVLERLREMPDESVNCVVTSPPYWGLRQISLTKPQ